MRTVLMAVCLATCIVAGAAPGERTDTAAHATDLQSRLAGVPNPTSGHFPDFDPRYPPPEEEAPTAFKLSQEYPQAFIDEKFPWMEIDFRAFPTEYLASVLSYCLEGNVEVDFKVQDNKVRKWYHAPWLHDDGERFGAGREYHYGLTRERRAREFELHRDQKSKAQNWAVGFYNDRGGFALGRVWKTESGYPDPSKSDFPVNAVACKLLFTDASTEEVPYLAGSKKWTANIYPDTTYSAPRVDKEMSLLQVDVAVKDPRVADTTGWVFGTFVYDGAAPGTTVWDRLIPVGLSWGDDSAQRTHANRNGVFVNTTLAEARINSSLVEVASWDYGHRAYVRHHGLGGRFNGPVDNPISSCISCHGRAGNYADSQISENTGKPMEFALFSITKPSDFPLERFDHFFGHIPGGPHIEIQNGERFMTTDYSLQISAGIRNFYQNLRQQPILKTLYSRGLSADSPEALRTMKPLPKVTREID